MSPIARLVILLLAASVITARADVKVCAIFGNHMVLQRDAEIPVWGTAAPGEQVTVSLGDDKASATVDQDGKWKLKLAARPASATPVDLTIAGRNSIVCHDVLIGDVWIASGQSNMDWEFFWGDGILNTNEEMAAADFPLIRDCKVATGPSPEPRDDMRAGWVVCTPWTATSPRFSSGIEHFTAVGYFFARELYRKLKIPIGLVNSSDGGTQIEDWLDPDSVKQFPAIEERWQKRMADDAAAGTSPAPAQAIKKPSPEQDLQRPAGLFNAMIHPFLGYAFKGVIWYQGENNVKRAVEYQKLFPALIGGWRAQFGRGDFPFYWAQLSNYDFEGANGTAWAFLREAQTMTLSVPNTGQAITLDIGDPGNVHLHNKQEVGRRLALIALARTYGFKDIVDAGPIFDHADLTANPVKVYFRNADSGLAQLPLKVIRNPAVPAESPSGLGGFELAGEDQVFHPAEARLSDDHNFVAVTCPAVSKPVALRYAWRNDPKNLVLGNQAGLPAAPFRTDSWPEDPAELAK
jgi:sialate O-acetylesterase